MIGIDIVEHERIKKVLDKWGDRFLKKILSSDEIKEFYERKDKISFLASRWAAKEAFVKMLGEKNFSLKEVKVLKRGKKPFILFKGSYFYVSIAHERSYSIAVCMAPFSGVSARDVKTVGR